MRDKSLYNFILNYENRLIKRKNLVGKSRRFFVSDIFNIKMDNPCCVTEWQIKIHVFHTKKGKYIELPRQMF